MAAAREEAQKVQRAMKRAGKRKAAEEAVVVDGPSEEARPKKRAKMAESNAGPDREPEMEAAETACMR